MTATIASLNKYAEEFGITEVLPCYSWLQSVRYIKIFLQPSLMNFCVTDGESIVVTRYISSRVDEAASLVCLTNFGCFLLLITLSSGFRRVHRSVNMLKVVTTE